MFPSESFSMVIFPFDKLSDLWAAVNFKHIVPFLVSVMLEVISFASPGTVLIVFPEFI